jgi:hypothetical protein
MTDQNLTELLERAANRVPVGPVPVAGMVSGAGRVRRRRRLTLSLASAAAVAAVAAGVAVLSAPGGSSTQQLPATSPTPVAAPGTRLVGVGHAAIAVPEEWGTNVTRCGVPQKDTVVIDVGRVQTCGTQRPEGVDSVEVTPGEPRFDFTVDETLTVDGVRAERQATTCEEGGFGGPRVCSGTVYVPAMSVAFRAESSTSSAEVDRILERIRVVPGQVGVPGYQTIAVDEQGKSGETYVEVLQEAGLTAEIRTRKVPAVDPGFVLEVAPRPGTLLTPGAVVAVTVVAEPDGPADEVRVGMNSVDAEENYNDVDDAQIRAGATISLAVGDQIWAYAAGRRANTLAGQLDGSSLAVDGRKEGPNYPHSWLAVIPGRTKVTLTITADGKPVVLGVVTVNVS